MNNKWKWILGLTLMMVLMLVSPFVWGFFISNGMMTNTTDWYMPMIYGTPGLMALGMIFLIWLILVISLILIGLGIVWLVREISAQKYF